MKNIFFFPPKCCITIQKVCFLMAALWIYNIYMYFSKSSLSLVGWTLPHTRSGAVRPQQQESSSRQRTAPRLRGLRRRQQGRAPCGSRYIWSWAAVDPIPGEDQPFVFLALRKFMSDVGAVGVWSITSGVGGRGQRVEDDTLTVPPALVTWRVGPRPKKEEECLFVRSIC